MKFIGMLFAVFLLSAPVLAKHDSDHPLTADDWKEVMEKVVAGSANKVIAYELGISERTLRYKIARMREAGISVPR